MGLHDRSERARANSTRKSRCLVRCHRKRLAQGAKEWEISTAMFAVKVDPGKRLRLKVLRPGDYYEPEVVSLDQINFRRVPPPQRRKLTKAQALAAIEKSRLRFTRTWDKVKAETRA